ncbi:hypothetical protein pipiens_017756, partial [Culex pipiens pipiens]
MLQLAEFAVNSFWIYCTLSVVVMVTLVTTLASCLCCRKQEIKASNAPHRSLPDIPVVEPAGDNNSELYATVGENKVQDLPQGRS